MPRWTHLLLVLLLVPVLAFAHEARPVTLQLSPQIDMLLDVVAGGMRKEIPVCLRGSVRQGKFSITKYQIPHILYSDTISLFFSGCKGALGLWHNHPADTRVPPGKDRTWLCALSAEDLATAHRDKYPLMVVQVDEKIRCWWTRAQLENLPYSPYTASIPGQRTF